MIQVLFSILLSLIAGMFIVTQVNGYRNRVCKCSNRPRQIDNHFYCSKCGKFRGVVYDE